MCSYDFSLNPQAAHPTRQTERRVFLVLCMCSACNPSQSVSSTSALPCHLALYRWQAKVSVTSCGTYHLHIFIPGGKGDHGRGFAKQYPRCSAFYLSVALMS